MGRAPQSSNTVFLTISCPYGMWFVMAVCIGDLVGSGELGGKGT